MTKEPIITLKDVSVKFQGMPRPIVKHVSLTVNKGERLLIAGPSGCGKSTLAYVLNGTLPRAIEATLTGEVELKGERLADQSIRQVAQKIGILFQDPESQFCMQTVEEEVAFGLENLHIPQAEMEVRISQSLVQVGLAEERKSQLHQLSGGMKQRLGLACLLAMDPEVLILDEPTANLDPAGATELLDVVVKLAETSGKTLIFIEHRLDRMIPYIDRVILMNKEGALLASGTPRKLYREQMQLFEQEGAAVPLVCERASAMMTAGHEWHPFPLTVEEGERQLAVSGELSLNTPQIIEQTLSKQSSTNAWKLAPVMEVKDIVFHYRRKKVLSGVSFPLFPAEITALLGSNGAGKSTLVQLLAKLLKSHAGTIKLKDISLTKWKDRELYKTIGYVFQNPEHQFLRDTVESELVFGLDRGGLSERQWKRKIEAQLAAFGLKDVRNQHPFQLSQGQKRRLSVATMLSNEQELLMLDEPTFGQDARYTDLLMSMMLQLRAAGKTILLITHDVELVRKYTDRALVLHNGQIAYDGPPESLFEERVRLHTFGLQAPLSKRLEQWPFKRSKVTYDA